MKKNLFLFLTICVMSLQAQVEPKLSNATETFWYYIQFTRGSAVIQDMGVGAKLLTKEGGKEDAQVWKLVGNSLTEFKLINKLGHAIGFSTTDARFTAEEAANAVLFELQQNALDANSWDLHRKGAGGGNMNSFGGSGVDKLLGEWSSDLGCALKFVDEADMAIRQTQPEQLREIAYTGTKMAPEEKLSLWYTAPATDWMTQALPIGNGQFGAMIFGGIHQDEVQFNDKTLWKGGETSYGAYQNFGNLYINQTEITTATNYRRELDIANAVARVSYTENGVDFLREYIASNPDSCIAIKLTASELGKINVDLQLWNYNGSAPIYTQEGATFKGHLDLVSYACKMSIKTDGGTIEAKEDRISVSGANCLTIYLVGGTNYAANSATYIYDKEELMPTIEAREAAVKTKTFETVKAAHVTDYKSWFDKVKFELAGTHNSFPTPDLIRNYNSVSTGKDLFLEELYFNYGRYLLISSSRGVDLPANLQGIWNQRNDPPWNSDIHSNINVQMNYWPAEVTNLGELHLPFLNYIYNEAMEHKQWQRNAKNAGQTKGWTLYTENNIFGYHGGFMHNYVIANAWYCMHMWQHYRYTLNQEFLKEKAFPVMKSCCDFWMERLIKDRTVNDDTWVCPNEYSPEHGPSEDATAHSQQLVWDLFNTTLQAIELLGDDAGVTAEFLTELKDKFEHLDTGLAIERGRNGENLLREWKYSNYTAGQQGHRHMSHLVGLYPGNQISPLKDVRLFTAAVNSLKDRGDAATGWSMGWKINLWARALDGDHARLILTNALRLAGGSGGIYYNLFDAHPPFQIDGNFGATSGIAEMLLQSHMDTLQILPALPTAWKKGSVKGLKAVGDFVVDLDWEYGMAKTITLTSNKGGNCAIAYPHIKDAVIKNAQGEVVTATGLNENRILLSTEAGMTYTLEVGTIQEVTSVIAYQIDEQPAEELTETALTLEKGHKVVFTINEPTATYYIWEGPNNFMMEGANLKTVTFDNILPFNEGAYQIIMKDATGNLLRRNLTLTIPGKKGLEDGYYTLETLGKCLSNRRTFPTAGKLFFSSKKEGDKQQGWQINKQGEKYVIKSLFNERYLMNSGEIDAEGAAYNEAIHGFKIYNNGEDHYALQTGAAYGNRYMIYKSLRLQPLVVAAIPTDFPIDFVTFDVSEQIEQENRMDFHINNALLIVDNELAVSVALFDILGNCVCKTDTMVLPLPMKKGVFLVRISLRNGQTIVRKIIL